MEMFLTKGDNVESRSTLMKIRNQIESASSGSELLPYIEEALKVTAKK